jgi:2-polyprenyl-3-methyl-5-hydroxy-6-metoxy-1,4-benzoquinol methylase/transcription initiation factor TFIIIB Brf1 subunit/transcription initiation factor TFIIB
MDPQENVVEAADVVRVLASNLEISRDSFNRIVDRIVGRFVLFSRDSTESTIQTDAAGLSAIYYTEGGIVGSHAHLVADASGLDDMSPFADSAWETGNSVSYLPGLATIFSGVRQLTPNTELLIPAMQVRRVYPRRPPTQMSVADAVDQLHPLLTSEVAMLPSRSDSLLVSVTAGIDSRTTLATLHPIADRIRLFTYTPTYGRFADLPIVQTDRVIAQQIAHRLGFELFEAVIEADSVDSEIRHLLELNVHHEHIWPLAQWYLENLAPGTLHIRSNLSEIGRAFYRKGKARTLPLDPEMMVRTYRGRSPSVRIAREAFEEFAEVTGFEAFEGFDPYDLFYWEQRMGRWHANLVAESDLSHDTWILLNSRQMLEILLSVPLEDRLAASVFRSLIRRSWPQLMRWPINAVAPDDYRGSVSVIEADESDLGRISLNADRISELYKGEIVGGAAQARARRRVNWMIGQVSGERVLDLGCSQGIASILLGREGFEVVGVDLQESHIEYANADLALESVTVRERVQFIVGEASALDLEDDTFDTVLLGNLLEHLAVPERVLAETRRVLRSGGKIVITTPFGALGQRDRKQTFFPKALIELLAGSFGVQSADVEEEHFRIVCVKQAETKPEVVAALDESVMDAVRSVQEELSALRGEATRAQSELEEQKEVASRLGRKASLLEKRLAEIQQSKEKVETAWRSTKSDLNAIKSEASGLSRKLDEANRVRSEAEKKLTSVSEELKRASAQAQLASRMADDLATTRQRLTQRDAEIAKLRHRIAISDWKLASLRQRRWWRLGGELASVRRRPWTVFSLPLRVLNLLRSSSPRLPRPAAPTDKPSGVEGSEPGTDASVPAAHDIHAVIPRHDRAAVTIAGRQLDEYLSHEMEVFRLDADSWSEQLERLTPHYLIVDSGSPRLRQIELEAVLDVAGRSGMTTVLWDASPEVLAPDEKADFDIICGDGKPPTDEYAGRATEVRGVVQARIHNPIGAHRRRKDATSVDLDKLSLGEVAYESVSDLVREAKNYKVLRGSGTREDVAAAILASATPLIVTESEPRHGIWAHSEEEAVALERSLLRSDVLRARMSHPLMRSVMRERSIGADVDRALGIRNGGLPRIDVMVATKRPENLEKIFENLGRQSYPNSALYLVGHGIDLDRSRAQDLADQVSVELASVLTVDESVILGEVFNIGFGATESEVIAKMDDDDFYGSEYLWDLYTALDFSGAEVAGKWAHYVYLEGVDSMVYRFKDYEHRFTEVVAISTLLMRREVLAAERFPAMPWGSGSVFLRALGAQGAQVFAGDRWNYLYIRGTDGAENTFPISDMKMLANSDVVCRGINLEEVVL